MKKKGIVLFMVFFLTACGFHLRGKIEIPAWLNQLSIISKVEDKEFVSVLTSQLESYNIQVYSDPALAKFWLIINRSTIQRQIISIGASTNPRQYQLILTLEFMLETSKAQIIKEPGLIVVTRQLTINNDRILGSNEEEALLIKEMKRDAVIQIINRLGPSPTYHGLSAVSGR